MTLHRCALVERDGERFVIAPSAPDRHGRGPSNAVFFEPELRLALTEAASVAREGFMEGSRSTRDLPAFTNLLRDLEIRAPQMVS